MATIDPNISDYENDIYDEEMAFLSRIQSRFLNLHQQTPAEYDDPDVKRLTEAMAAFMAKGRMTGKHQIDQLHQRVFHQLLPYLSLPLSSMGLIQANTRQLTEATYIKKGTAFIMNTDEGQQAEYRSLCTVPLQPLSIQKVGVQRSQPFSGNNDNSVILNIDTYSRVPGSINHLPLYLNVNDNYTLSLRL